MCLETWAVWLELKWAQSAVSKRTAEAVVQANGCWISVCRGYLAGQVLLKWVQAADSWGSQEEGAPAGQLRLKWVQGKGLHTGVPEEGTPAGRLKLESSGLVWCLGSL